MRPLLTALLVLLLAACDRSAAPAAEAMEVRHYTVPAERTDAVVNTLNGVLAGSEHQPGAGRASSDVDGMVVVLAPVRLHESIARTIGELAKPAPPSEGSVRIDYWLLDTLPGATADDASVAGLDVPLAAARAALGAVHFQLAGQAAQLTALGNGQRGRTEGFLNVVQETRPTAEGVHLGFSVDRNGTSGTDPTFHISGEVDLPFARTIVLSQQSAGAAGNPVQRLLLVRATPVAAP